MVRMIVSLPERDKKWLEQSGRRQGVSAAEVVRRAVACLRDAEPASQFQGTVRACAGRWKSVRQDSQKYVDDLRKEWESRP
jgi:hypothetical protein